MKTVLVTGGTVFVSRYVAEYYVKKGYDVYVLNRGTRKQSEGVKHIKADRRRLGEALREYHFDVIFDMTAYTEEDIHELLDAVGSYGQYMMLSSSAVYPEYAPRPFTEETILGENQYWGGYGTGKIAAEQALQKRDEKAYILRPPYLYGPYNNVYREAFVFDCALAGRPFFLPAGGEMTLQFFYIHDLCRFMDILLREKPLQRVWNVGNPESISIKEWVKLCYEAAGKTVAYRQVDPQIEQRKYFSFYRYEYALKVEKQQRWMPDIKPLAEGLKEAFQWYVENRDLVVRKDYVRYIDENLSLE